jgi:hypothetical protein
MMKWLRIDDLKNPPPKGRWIFGAWILNGDTNGYVTATVRLSSKSGWEEKLGKNNFEEIREPTHWMPLPKRST